MKTFTVTTFLLLSQVAHAEFGVDARGMKRRHSHDVASKSFEMTVRSKSIKSKAKKSTEGKKKSKGLIYPDVGEGMSYMSYQSKGTPSIDMSSEMTARSKIVEAQAKKSMKGRKKSKGLVFPDVGEGMSYSMSYPTLAESQKTSSADMSKAPKSKGAEKPKGSAKSKEGMNEKSKHSKKTKGAEEPKGSEKSKEGMKEKIQRSKKIKDAEEPKGSEKSKEGMNEKSKHSQKSQKTRDFTKYVRSSLPEPPDGVQSVEQIPERANILSSANAESSASAHVIKGAFIVAISFVVGGALIAA